MPALRDFQRAFAGGLLAQDNGACGPLIVGSEAEARARFGVYQNNVLGSLHNTLAEAFPAVASLVGGDFFRSVAHAFIRQAPPSSRVLAEFGRGFADFLDGFAGARGHPYLGDVARLDLAVHQALLAEEATPLSAQELAGVPTDAFATLKLRLHPSRRFVRSRFPVVAIRRMALADEDDQVHVNLDQGAAHALVVRPRASVEVHELTLGGFAMLIALDAGNTLTQAVEAALAVEDAFHPQACLERQLAADTFVAFTLDDTRAS